MHRDKVAPHSGQIDHDIASASASQLHALLLPSGVANPDSLRTDLTNAGAHWEDKTVIVDGNLMTSRNPNDLAGFCRAMVNLLASSLSRNAA